LLEDKAANISTEIDQEEEIPDYLRVRELFSYENFARIHREQEQLKDVVRMMRTILSTKVEKEIAELKLENAELKK
jgi:hypothetical protein